MKIDPLLICTQGVPQDKVKENSKKGWSEDTALPDSTVNVKGLGDVFIELHCPFMSVRKDFIRLCSFGGQPILSRALNRLSLLTRSKALVRSMNAMHSSFFCSLHFSWSCWSEKTMSIIDHLGWKPH